MRATLLLLSVLLTAGCATSDEAKMYATGKLLFSIRVTQYSNKVEDKSTGFFFFADSAGGIFAYQLRAGKYVDGVGEFPDLKRDIEKIGFEPFDFEAEAKTIDAARMEEARRDHTLIAMAPFDGAEYEIRYVFGGVDYTLKTWNPIQKLEMYGSRSPKMAKLKALIECFALSYGREKFKRGD